MTPPSCLKPHGTRKMHDLSPITIPGRNGERSSAAKRASSDKNKHATLTLQGPRGQHSPRPGQTPTLRHAAQTRQYLPRAVMTSTMTTGQIRPYKMHVRPHPLWDGINDKGFDLKAT